MVHILKCLWKRIHYELEKNKKTSLNNPLLPRFTFTPSLETSFSRTPLPPHTFPCPSVSIPHGLQPCRINLLQHGIAFVLPNLYIPFHMAKCYVNSSVLPVMVICKFSLVSSHLFFIFSPLILLRGKEEAHWALGCWPRLTPAFFSFGRSFTNREEGHLFWHLL